MMTILLIFIVLAGFALIWWGIGRLTIPEPIKTVVLVILGIVALVMIYNFVAGGGINLGANWRH
jgi:hypothetical protein